MYTVDQLETWFNKALDQPKAIRNTFLEKELAHDNRLLKTILELLEIEQQDKSAFTQLVDQMNRELEVEDIPVLDRYRVIDEVGRGGMSVVYLGERTDGLFEHKVAIKLLRSGMNSDELLRVFEKERNVLAKLKHPNIAQIYDAGLAEGNRPYFVMEYIEGSDLSSFLEEKEQPVEERLKLFIQICQAVHFAHQNTIIHRDIKPSNILVNDQGAAKLMDFGIADILGEETDIKLSNRLFTPEYASPEQKQGERIDVRSDVYQLGRLLAHVVARDEDDELAAIIEKATLENKSERYPSVTAFIEDLERKLSHWPVEVYNASLLYKTQLFIKRNLWQVGLGSIAILVLLMTSISYIINVNAARREAEKNEFRANTSLEFLVSLFEQSDPSINLGDTVSIGYVLEEGLANIQRIEDAYTKASVLNSLGEVYRSLGSYNKAEALFNQAMDIVSKGENDELIGKTLLNKGLLASKKSDQNRAFELFSLALEKPLSLENKVIALIEQAYIKDQSSPDSAMLLKERAYLIVKNENFSPVKSLKYQFKLSDIGFDQFLKKESDSITSLKLGFLRNFETNFSSNWPILSEMYAGIAMHYRVLNKYDSSIIYSKKNLEILEKMYGQGNIQTASGLQNLAENFGWSGAFDSAEYYTTKSIRIKEKAFGQEHVSQLNEMELLSQIYLNRNEFEKGEKLLRSSFQISSKAYGLYHKKTGGILYTLLQQLNRATKLKESTDLYPLLFQIDSSTYGLTVNTAMTLVDYGQALNALGESEVALNKFYQALDIIKKDVGTDDFVYGMTLFSIAKVHKSKNPQKALQFMDSALVSIENNLPKNHPRIGNYQQQYAVLLNQQGQHKKSNKYYLKAIDNYTINYKKKEPHRIAQFQEEYSKSLRKQGLTDSASSVMQRAKKNYGLANK